MKLPETKEELEDWINEHGNRIAVRENLDGKWDSYWLSELPFEIAEKHVKRWIAEGRIPVMYTGPLDEEEDEGESKQHV